MKETSIMPEDLKVGDTFRLTGSAEDPEEAADTRHFTVRELRCRRVGAVLAFLTLKVDVGGNQQDMTLGAWVPLIRLDVP